MEYRDVPAVLICCPLMPLLMIINHATTDEQPTET